MSSTFRVGDRVRIPLGRRQVAGVVTEDRGGIGFRGRHLYQVLVPMDPFDPTTYEVSEDEIEALAQEPEVTLDKAKIREYLSHGGLISILRSNLQGGRNQPRVWLRPDNVGNVTHTFDRGRGIVGGETVPFGVVHDDRVFTPKQDEVLSFLRSFGLSDDDIQDVLSSVGVAP